VLQRRIHCRQSVATQSRYHAGSPLKSTKGCDLNGGMISAMKILIVVGARPNFMKAAPILKAICEFNAVREEWADERAPVLVHTGQHYDAKMSGAFFADLDLPKPDVFLGVGSGSHAEQTAEIMKRFEPVLAKEDPDALVVVGDVNSTLACALVAAKMHSRPRIAHVEAGLRSFDRSMPEEINRILTDQISDLLFVSEESGMRNLRSEGISPDRVFFVGNTMIDSLHEHEAKAERSRALERFGLEPQGYVLLTLHRAANVDDRETFLEILEGLDWLAASNRVLFPAHPRTQKQIREHGLKSYFCARKIDHEKWHAGIQMVEPQGYVDFLCLMKNARMVITDSGGIQEETTALGVPCVTVRDNTERPVTLEMGTNLLAGTRRETIRAAAQRQLEFRGGVLLPEKWDGHAAERIVRILAETLASREAMAPEVDIVQIAKNAS
jgi:UDP-N-acetylglucosamine 2-epimerase (non-hydrolysing)